MGKRDLKFGGWLIVAVVAFAPAAAPSEVVQFAAPAGDLPAQHLGNAVYDAVLPSGRIVTPFGESVVCGMNALGMALTPDGRFAIVSNDDERQGRTRSAVDPQVRGGPSLAVVDTATMRIADRFVFPDETYFAGVTALADPRYPSRTLVFAAGGSRSSVFVLDLDARGHITPDVQHVIPIPQPIDAGIGDFGRSFPATLTASGDGRRIYAVDEIGGDVTAIDTATRSVSGVSSPVGFSPFGVALAGDELLVSNEGLMRYAPVADAPLVPAFFAPPADALRASSLSIVPLAVSGDFAPRPAAASTQALPMDIVPDGLHVIGGAHPTAIAVTPDAGYAFVAMTNVDRIATVRLGAAPIVAGGTELRLFDRGPYGTQPAALALSRDGTRLYVALAGLNAIAVLDARDPIHLHRLGLIPTGWFPSALALSSDDRTLYVLNTKGFGHDIGFTGDPTTGADANAVWSTVQKIDLGAVQLSATTSAALKNTRLTRSAAAPAYPRALRYVVVILEENTTFDAMLGDLGYGPADSSYVRFGAAITPNLHALARRYAVAGNIFADAGESDSAHAVASGGISTTYSERALLAKADRKPLLGHGENPEDYPRSGYIYDDLARHDLSFRDYGDWVRVAGYDDGAAADPGVDDPDFRGADDRLAPTQGLGGRYTYNVPAPAILAGHVDLDYPGWNVRIRDERRAREFIRDYSVLVDAHRQPRYTHIWLPADQTGDAPGLPPLNEQVADGDRALGTIVQYLSRLRSWKNTVIFVMPDAAQDSRDHVDENRTYAIVISPFAKRHFVGMRHLSTASVLKTSEQILHVPPLALGDLLATDMSDFFDAVPDPHPFAAIDVPIQTAGDSGAPDGPASSASGKPEP